MSQQMLHFFYPHPEFHSRIDYVLDFLEQHPLCPEGTAFRQNGDLEEGEIAIYYGQPKEKSGFYIPAQKIAFNTVLPAFAKLKPGRFRYKDTLLYSIVYHPEEREQLFCNDQCFGFDLLETIFLHISRMEEHHCTPEQLDTWDMMKSSEQFLSKHQLQEQAVVDQLVYCFFEALGLNVKPRKTSYRMSHDIDVIEKFSGWYQLLRSSGKLAVGGKGFSTQKKLINTYRKVKQQQQKDPYDTFDWLLTTHSWPQKIIYFMAGGITKYDNHYSVEDQRIKAAIELAKANGYTIGLHPSYAAWKDSNLFLKEKNKLEEIVGEEVKDSRQHFLHFSFAHTPELLEQHQMATDSTLGYQDLIGFRCGTGFPFRLYCFKEERAYQFLEIPLVFMDCALLGAENNVADYEIALRNFLAKNKYSTSITFNYHNSTFDPVRLDAARFKILYERLSDQEE